MRNNKIIRRIVYHKIIYLSNPSIYLKSYYYVKFMRTRELGVNTKRRRDEN